MNDDRTYISTDEHQVMRVGSTRVMLDSVVAAFQQGHSPEAIRAAYPSLSLEEVYGAIAYCLAHPDEISAYMERQEKVWEQGRARSEPERPPVVDRLRAIRQAPAGAR